MLLRDPGAHGALFAFTPGHDESGQDEIDALLLEVADPSVTSRIVLIGHGGLEMGCLLMRRGYMDVTIRSRECPYAEKADIAIVPLADSIPCIDRAVASARRILAPLGTIAIGLRASAPAELALIAKARLQMHGFSSILVRTGLGGSVVRGELPLHGGLSCA